eukprot:TRINITY_DN35630_c0_g1_i1.p1 TRINITY_DN35630_c0_g1~~TRINITY_DN35630_c0_g1_i1.p1  ORF type:complete len:596 (-),score=106.53 TRINITY_DN35630_c0_g1_i1:76-1863(-)
MSRLQFLYLCAALFSAYDVNAQAPGGPATTAAPAYSVTSTIAGTFVMQTLAAQAFAKDANASAGICNYVIARGQAHSTSPTCEVTKTYVSGRLLGEGDSVEAVAGNERLLSTMRGTVKVAYTLTWVYASNINVAQTAWTQLYALTAPGYVFDGLSAPNDLIRQINTSVNAYTETQNFYSSYFEPMKVTVFHVPGNHTTVPTPTTTTVHGWNRATGLADADAQAAKDKATAMKTIVRSGDVCMHFSNSKTQKAAMKVCNCPGTLQCPTTPSIIDNQVMSVMFGPASNPTEGTLKELGTVDDTARASINEPGMQGGVSFTSYGQGVAMGTSQASVYVGSAVTAPTSGAMSFNEASFMTTISSVGANFPVSTVHKACVIPGATKASCGSHASTSPGVISYLLHGQTYGALYSALPTSQQSVFVRMKLCTANEATYLIGGHLNGEDPSLGENGTLMSGNYSIVDKRLTISTPGTRLHYDFAKKYVYGNSGKCKAQGRKWNMQSFDCQNQGEGDMGVYISPAPNGTTAANGCPGKGLYLDFAIKASDLAAPGTYFAYPVTITSPTSPRLGKAMSSAVRKTYQDVVLLFCAFMGVVSAAVW